MNKEGYKNIIFIYDEIFEEEIYEAMGFLNYLEAFGVSIHHFHIDLNHINKTPSYLDFIHENDHVVLGLSESLLENERCMNILQQFIAEPKNKAQMVCMHLEDGLDEALNNPDKFLIPYKKRVSNHVNLYQSMSSDNRRKGMESLQFKALQGCTNNLENCFKDVLDLKVISYDDFRLDKFEFLLNHIGFNGDNYNYKNLYLLLECQRSSDPVPYLEKYGRDETYIRYDLRNAKEEKRYDDFVELFDELTKVSDRITDVILNYYGEVMYNGERFAEGVELFETAIEYNENCAPAIANLGFHYFLKEDYDKSEELLLRAVKLNERKINVLEILGFIYAYYKTDVKDAKEKAIFLFERAIELDHFSERGLFELAKLIDSDPERLAMSLSLYKRVLDINPDNDEARERLTTLHIIHNL